MALMQEAFHALMDAFLTQAAAIIKRRNPVAEEAVAEEAQYQTTLMKTGTAANGLYVLTVNKVNYVRIKPWMPR
jgi:hypothetical protein